MEMEENIAPQWKVKDEDSDGDGGVVDVDPEDGGGGLPRGKGWVRKNKMVGGKKMESGLNGAGGKGRGLAREVR